MKQTLKNIYNTLMFKVKFFIWKHNRTDATVKEFLHYQYSKKLIEESVKLITAQQQSKNPPTDLDLIQFIGVIPEDWLERLEKKIEERMPDWVDKVEQLKAEKTKKNS